jgi:hypothetical protein
MAIKGNMCSLGGLSGFMEAQLVPLRWVVICAVNFASVINQYGNPNKRVNSILLSRSLKALLGMLGNMGTHQYQHLPLKVLWERSICMSY